VIVILDTFQYRLANSKIIIKLSNVDVTNTIINGQKNANNKTIADEKNKIEIYAIRNFLQEKFLLNNIFDNHQLQLVHVIDTNK